MTEPRVFSQVKWSDTQRAEIAEELDRILADPRFKTSQRCVQLLHHLVESALNGNCEGIKERTLGIEVFGRDADYEPNTDPIVRRTASEIRRRLDQYYQDPSSRHGVRIRLAAGGYLPQFDFGVLELPAQPVESRELAVPWGASEAEIAHAGHPRHFQPGLWRKRILWCAAVLLVLAGAALVVSRTGFWHSTVYRVWEPFLDKKQGLFVCLPDDGPAVPDTNARADAEPHQGNRGDTIHGGPGNPHGANPEPKVLFMDATIAYRIYSRLQAYDVAVALRSSSQVRMHQFRHRSIVLVGGFNNPWSMLVLSNLRYSLREDPATGAKWIQDAHDPLNREWMDGGSSTQTNADYSLISRFWDAETGGWVMVLSGLDPFGTDVAAALLTDPSMESLLPPRLSSATNYQLILKTSVVEGSAGSPQIVAVHTW